MLKRRSLLLFLFVLLGITGCASMKPVPLDPVFWHQQGRRVVIVLDRYPPAELIVDVSTINAFAGQRQYQYGGILDSPAVDSEPMRYSELQPLRDAINRMTPDSFSVVRDFFLKGLQERGFDAFTMDRPLDVRELPKFRGGSGEGVYERKDFRGTGSSVRTDYILLVELKRYGPYAHYLDLYNDYVEVRVQIRAELLDAGTNRVLWRTGYQEGDLRKPVEAMANRPDHIPAILDAQNDLLKEAAGVLFQKFFSSRP